MADDSTSMMDVPHAAEVGAAVGAPPTVTLYDAEGHPITVPEADGPYWLTRGFAEVAYDLESLRGQVSPLARAAEAALAAYIDGVVRDGQIDQSDIAEARAAEVALEELLTLNGHIKVAISSRYPVRQFGEAVLMRRPDGGTVEVDPSQAALYETEHGFIRAG